MAERPGLQPDTQVHELTPDTAIFGIGASTFTPFGTPSEFPESTFAGWLESSWQKARNTPTPCWFRTIRPRTAPATSSRAISMWALLPCANSLKKPSPMSACADISTKRAPWTGVGRTIVVNPGALAQGGYVLLRSCGGKLSVELRVLENCD